MARTAPRPTPADRSIPLTAREFTELQGVCAVAALQLQAIKQQADAAIAAALAPQQQLLARLAVKYRARGLKPDGAYRFDPATHALVPIGDSE